MTLPLDWAGTVALLGKLSDRVIAEALGCSQQSVWMARKRMGIPAYQPHRPIRRWSPPWQAAARPLLGQQSDAAVAEAVGVSTSSIARYRCSLGIPARRVWTAKPTETRWAAQPLGQVPDAVIAAQLGLSCQCVSRARRERGIPALASPRTSRLPADLPYGQVSDAAIARQQGMCAFAVACRRRQLGIPAYRRSSPAWHAAAIPLLGTMPDADVARIAGVHLMTVLRLRQARGVPSWRAQGRPAAPQGEA